jgi:hypothetical protein
MTTFEDEDIFENAEKEIQHVPMDIDSSSANSGAAADTGPIDYNLYRIFWDIQRFFRQYHVVMDNPVEWDTFVSKSIL